MDVEKMFISIKREAVGKKPGKELEKQDRKVNNTRKKEKLLKEKLQTQLNKNGYERNRKRKSEKEK